jgi:hypothetical protein
VFGLAAADFPDHFEKFVLLEQRFAAGDDGAGAVEGEDAVGGLGRRELEGHFGFPVFGVAGDGVLFVRPRGFFEIPSVVGIAPVAVEIAARGADEDCGSTDRDSFALDGVENFRAVAEFREFHGRH